LKIKYSLVLLLFFLLFPLADCHNREFVNSPYVAEDFSQVSEEWSHEQLIKSAEMIANKPVVTIQNQRYENISPGKGSYVSLACYWWPNPESEDGLPYIRKDGSVNPETRSPKSDLPALTEMAKRVELLSSAYQVSGDVGFAHAAVEQLYAWFLDKNTAMLPHLEHAQMVKGLNTGRSYGVIDTWWLVRVVESIGYLQKSSAWNEELNDGLERWFTHYLNWLRNSEFGLTEMESKNNHGTWYDLQVITFAMFTGQDEYAKNHLEMVTLPRMNRQIGFTGRQPRETRRPRPVHYSIFNLYGWMKLAEFGEELGVDISGRKSFMNAGIHRAAVYLTEMVNQTSFDEILDQVDKTDSDRLYLELMVMAWNLYDDPRFIQEIDRIWQYVRIPEMILSKNQWAGQGINR
jgi:hypothetical protein